MGPNICTFTSLSRFQSGVLIHVDFEKACLILKGFASPPNTQLQLILRPGWPVWGWQDSISASTPSPSQAGCTGCLPWSLELQGTWITFHKCVAFCMNQSLAGLWSVGQDWVNFARINFLQLASQTKVYSRQKLLLSVQYAEKAFRRLGFLRKFLHHDIKPTSVASSAPPRDFPPAWATSCPASPSGGGRWAPARWARSPSSWPGCPWQTLMCRTRSYNQGCSLGEEYELKHCKTEAHKPKAVKNMRKEN